MRRRKMRIEIVQGDITQQEVDAIVNAANERGLGGGGVDGAIHQAAGPALLEECRKIPEKNPGIRILKGTAVATGAGNLKAKKVIHTVGPDCRIQKEREKKEEILKNAYTNSLKVADEEECKSVAFPSISTGIYGYNIEEAAKVALEAIKTYPEKHPKTKLEIVRMVLFSDKDYQVYKEIYEKIK